MIKLIKTKPDNQPSDFVLLAQNMETYEIIGETEQDGYDIVNEIPYGFLQRVHSIEDGAKEYMLYEEIKSFKTKDQIIKELEEKVQIQTAALDEILFVILPNIIQG